MRPIFFLLRWIKSRKKITKLKDEIPADSANPKGPFYFLTKDQVPKYQSLLNQIFVDLDIKNKQVDYQWNEEDGEIIMSLAGPICKKDGLSFLYLQTLLELYLDADPMIRGLIGKHWVWVVLDYDVPPESNFFGRDFFSDPWTFMIDVKKRFFLEEEIE